MSFKRDHSEVEPFQLIIDIKELSTLQVKGNRYVANDLQSKCVGQHRTPNLGLLMRTEFIQRFQNMTSSEEVKYVVDNNQSARTRRKPVRLNGIFGRLVLISDE